MLNVEEQTEWAIYNFFQPPVTHLSLQLANLFCFEFSVKPGAVVPTFLIILALFLHFEDYKRPKEGQDVATPAMNCNLVLSAVVFHLFRVG